MMMMMVIDGSDDKKDDNHDDIYDFQKKVKALRQLTVMEMIMTSMEMHRWEASWAHRPPSYDRLLELNFHPGVGIAPFSTL